MLLQDKMRVLNAGWGQGGQLGNKNGGNERRRCCVDPVCSL